jgi:signal transduction histidine kinase/ActR/RegA family two-component response regulator
MKERLATGWWASLRGRLILLALIAFLPLFGLSAYRAIEARERALAEARAVVVRLAQAVELTLALRIQGSQNLVHAMAANPKLRGNDFAACSAALAAQLKLDQRYATFALLGRDGKLLCHSDPAAGPVNYADRDHFRRVLETRRPLVGTPVIGRVAKRVIVPVDQPLLDAKGEVQRVLTAALDLSLARGLISHPPLVRDLAVTISDEEGRVLYREPDNDKWFGHLEPNAPINQALHSRLPGEAFEALGLDGVRRVYALARSRVSPEGSLVIRVGAGRDALTAAADRALAVEFVVLVIIAGLVLFAVILVAEKFVRGPVGRLALAAGGLGEGDLSVRVPEAEFRGELAGLAAAFNAMAAGLAARTAEVRAQLEQLSLLNRITRSIGERQDLSSIFQVVVRALEESLLLDFACICLHDKAAAVLRVTCVGAKSAALALDLALLEQAEIDIDENGLSRCVHGQLVYEADIGQSASPLLQRLARGGLGSLVMAPLRCESRVFGVLVAARRSARGFGDVECEFLRRLSEHVALAAHQAQLHGALQQAYDDLHRTQQAVMQQERLRAMGQMASGIAHDINNALSPVSLYAESLLETEQSLSERARRYLQTIQRAVDDVGQTVARMREFYRPREPQLVLAPVEVNRLVQEVADLTRARWSDMPQLRGVVIRPRIALAADLPKIMGIESEIREALVNLVFNAVDAMPAGGTLTLRTRLADIAGGSSQGALAIEVADEGVGMDEDTRQRCLEPFFTTKGERGTGLGLAMVYGMAQRHGAEIEIDSAPGAGTRVRLVFPVVAGTVPECDAKSLTHEAPLSLRLLLIDDDPLHLESLRDTLQVAGHVTVTADGGDEGLSVFRASLECGESFAAVITDLGMPHVDGHQVAAGVKEASPATPVILLTGWGRRFIADDDDPPYADLILAKPAKLHELRDALADLCRRGADGEPTLPVESGITGERRDE